MFFHHRRRGFQFGDHLHARLRLPRLAGGGAEAVDEGLHVGALGLDLTARGRLKPQAFEIKNVRTSVRP